MVLRRHRRIETVQVIAYAARVLQLARQVFGEKAAPLEPAFLARLAEARSNDPAAGTAPASTGNVSTPRSCTRTGGRALRHQFHVLHVCR